MYFLKLANIVFFISVAVAHASRYVEVEVAAADVGNSNRSRSRSLWDENGKFLVFGDSYTYVQGVHGRRNYSFIGDALNPSFTPSKLLSNEIIINQTSAGGPNWVEYLSGCYSEFPALCRRQLWDFAFAGAGVSEVLLPLHHDFTLDLVNQVLQWDRYAKDTLKVDGERDVVGFFIGINDINDSAKWKNISTAYEGFYELVVGEYFNSVEKVYNSGYRNFLFLNLPPLERTPSNLASSNPLPNFEMITFFNNILASQAAAFAERKSDTKVLVFDTYRTLRNILNEPGRHGIRNTTHFCPRYDAPDIDINYKAYGCNRIAEYFWYNSGHVTFTVHEVLATAVRKALEVWS